MAELALDHVERDAFARHLDRVRVTELMRGEAAPDAGADGEAAQGPSEQRTATRAGRLSGRR
ncbi:MAG: hypothetical protein QOE13_3408 [Gaiellaceae bacterium]|jgi:hypothetical protein|nr:hypothetical protein [Gaiellaceae bacterium]